MLSIFSFQSYLFLTSDKYPYLSLWNWYGIPCRRGPASATVQSRSYSALWADSCPAPSKNDFPFSEFCDTLGSHIKPSPSHILIIPQLFCTCTAYPHICILRIRITVPNLVFTEVFLSRVKWLWLTVLETIHGEFGIVICTCLE